MAVFLEENQATNPVQANRGKGKVDFYGNIYLNLRDGDGNPKKHKLCAANLVVGREVDDLIINGFKEDPEGFLETLKNHLVFELNSSTPTKKGYSF